GIHRSNPRFVPINGPLIGWYLSPFLCDLPGTSASSLDISNFTWRRRDRSNPHHFFAEAFDDVCVSGLRRLLRQRFYAHVIRRAPEMRPSQAVLVIKEPNGSQSADIIMRALPRSRLLFLLRDGRDVIDSLVAAYVEGSWATQWFSFMRGLSEDDRREFVVTSAHKWLWQTEVVQSAFREHVGPKYMVRYEELLRDPARHMR